MADDIIQVDPATLYLPPGRRQGAEPTKFWPQVSRFDTSLAGMPPLELIRGAGGKYRVQSGVTRASRAAMMCPGQTVPARVIHDFPHLDVTRELTIAEALR